MAVYASEIRCASELARHAPTVFDDGAAFDGIDASQVVNQLCYACIHAYL